MSIGQDSANAISKICFSLMQSNYKTSVIYLFIFYNYSQYIYICFYVIVNIFLEVYFDFIQLQLVFLFLKTVQPPNICNAKFLF